MSTPNRGKININRKGAKMLEINEIQKRLKLVNVMAFSKLAGVHPNSLYRVRDGSSKETVSYATIKKYLTH